MKAWLALVSVAVLLGCAPEPRPAPPPSRPETHVSPRLRPRAQREPKRLPAGGDCRADLEGIRQRLATIPPPANTPYLVLFGAFGRACAKARGTEIEAVSRLIRGSPLGSLLSRPAVSGP